MASLSPKRFASNEVVSDHTVRQVETTGESCKGFREQELVIRDIYSTLASWVSGNMA
jgi:hypothetical protein